MLIFRPLPAPFPGQQMWGAQARDSSYIIVKDNGLYTASARISDRKVTAHVVPFEGGVITFEEAQEACERHHNRS